MPTNAAEDNSWRARKSLLQPFSPIRSKANVLKEERRAARSALSNATQSTSTTRRRSSKSPAPNDRGVSPRWVTRHVYDDDEPTNNPNTSVSGNGNARGNSGEREIAVDSWEDMSPADHPPQERARAVSQDQDSMNHARSRSRSLSRGRVGNHSNTSPPRGGDSGTEHHHSRPRRQD